MPKKRWVRPLLAFVITFGALATLASVVRVIAVYRRLFSLGMAPDDPTIAQDAMQELSRMDQLYTPMFFLVALTVSALAAVVFARWRPRERVELPPPLPPVR